MNVRELLAERCRQHRDRAAFVEGATGRTLTWGEIAHRPAPQPGPGGLAVLRSGDPLDTIAAFLSALSAGVPVRPTDPSAPVPELVAPAPGAALVMTSSGTTGRPKVIPLTEAQLLHTARAVVDHHRLTADDRGYCPLPLFHINALVVGVLSTLVAGSTLVVDARFSRSRFWSTLAEHGVTWVNAVPAIITILAAAGPAPDHDVAARIRFVRSASAPLAPATRERFETMTGIGVLETYGMTEAASQICANPLDPAERRAGSVGRPVAIGLRIVEAGSVDPDRNPLPHGHVGEVEIRGPSVISTSFDGTGGPDGWLPTSDLGRLDADGFLYLVGRADDVINRGGEKVYPADVERVLLADPRVTAAAVVARPHPVTGQEPIAVVIAEAGPADRDDLAADLLRRCEASLSRFMVPAQITVADTLPAGPTGKVRRAELRAAVLHMQRSSS